MSKIGKMRLLQGCVQCRIKLRPLVANGHDNTGQGKSKRNHPERQLFGLGRFLRAANEKKCNWCNCCSPMVQSERTSCASCASCTSMCFT